MKKKTIILILIMAALLLILVGGLFVIPKIKSYIPYYKDKMGIDQQDLPYTLTIEKKDFENEVV